MSNTIKRQTQQERRSQADQQMFESAVNLIVERGPDKTTLTDIGINAGYSRGLATYRYKTKDAFFSVLTEHLHQLWCSELNATIDHSQGLETAVAAVTALQNFIQSNPNCLLAMYKLFYYSIDHSSEMTQRLKVIHHNQREQARGWAQQAIESQSAHSQLDINNFAEQYCALVFGGIYQWLVSPEQVDLHNFLENSKQSLKLIALGHL